MIIAPLVQRRCPHCCPNHTAPLLPTHASPFHSAAKLACAPVSFKTHSFIFFLLAPQGRHLLCNTPWQGLWTCLRRPHLTAPTFDCARRPCRRPLLTQAADSELARSLPLQFYGFFRLAALASVHGRPGGWLRPREFKPSSSWPLSAWRQVRSPIAAGRDRLQAGMKGGRGSRRLAKTCPVRMGGCESACRPA